jgi:hypothetical protein
MSMHVLPALLFWLVLLMTTAKKLKMRHTTKLEQSFSLYIYGMGKINLQALEVDTQQNLSNLFL